MTFCIYQFALWGMGLLPQLTILICQHLIFLSDFCRMGLILLLEAWKKQGVWKMQLIKLNPGSWLKLWILFSAGLLPCQTIQILQARYFGSIIFPILYLYIPLYQSYNAITTQIMPGCETSVH